VAAILQQHDAISDMALRELLQRRLFAVTRRSLHADLQILALNWAGKRQGSKNIAVLPSSCTVNSELYAR